MNNDQKLERSFIFYVAALLFFAVGGITTIGLPWYETLTIPSWTPPELLVAFIWGALFLCTAISVSLFWEKSNRSEASFKSIIGMYMANALLLLLWNYLFFGMHRLDVAFWVAVVVGVSVLVIMARLWKEARTSALLLLPYLAWMLYALFLTYEVLVLNP